MPDPSNPLPRRRPVDALFGEEVELQPKPAAPADDTRITTPGYKVEPPRPVTTLRPPPPELPNDWRLITAEPATQVAAPTEPTLQGPHAASPPPDDQPPTADRRPQAATPAEFEHVPLTPPLGQPAPSAPSAASSSAPTVTAPIFSFAPSRPIYGQAEFLELSQFVDQLFQSVSEEVSDHVALNAECQDNLRRARTAIEKGEYAQAEYYAEQVKARLLRARASRAAAANLSTRAILVWLVAAALLGVMISLLPLALRIVPLVIPLLRAVGLGILGASVAALVSAGRALRDREYDASSNLDRALAPLRGGAVGLIMFLLSITGLVAAPGALGVTFDPYLVLYLFAFLAALGSDPILDKVRGMFSTVVRSRAR